MTVQNLWPLVFLIFIPIVIFLYILKKRVKDEAFSSTLLWKEVYKNLEAETPFEKLRHNILMYLQILLLLLMMFALMAPIIKNGGFAQEHAVIVIDHSASMQFLYNDKETRLEHSIKEAKKEIDGMSDRTVITLITVSDEARVLYQGQDKSTIKKRLKSIKPTLAIGNFDLATDTVQSVISDMDNGQVIGYTDTKFSSQEWIQKNKKVSLLIENVFSTKENCSLDYVNYGTDEEGTEVLCKISNHGKREITQDVSLYVDSNLVQVLPVTVKPHDHEVVYFDKLSIKNDGSVTIRAELSKKDALVEDNSQSARVTDNILKRVLLLSKGNVFLEKGLSLNSNVEVYKSDNVNILNQTEDVYDLYVFDGIYVPEDFDFSNFSSKADFLFVNYNQDFCAQNYIEHQGNEENTVFYFMDSAVTKYMDSHAIGITNIHTYSLPGWGTPFLKNENGDIAGYYGSIEEHNIGVLGFDIHNTDFALQAEFPIFMSQFIDFLLGNQIMEHEIINFPTADESEVIPVDTVEEKAVQGKKKVGGREIRNLILLLVLVLLFIEWLIYIKQTHTTKKVQFFVIRCIVLLCIILAMIGLSIPKHQKKNETIFLVDVSDSMSGNIEKIEQDLQYVMEDMPKKNVSGVIAFGKDTAVDKFLSKQKNFKNFTAEPIKTSTNIENAIKSAISLFNEGVGKRIVLITDGSENEGNMTSTTKLLEENKVEFLVVPFEDSIANHEEVYINHVLTPNVIHDGDHYNVTVSVTSNVDTSAVLSLYSGRNLKGQQKVHLTKGENKFVFEDVGIEGTIAEYKAVIESNKDTISVNNSFVTFAEIEAPPKILLVEGKNDEAMEFEKVLEAANIQYDKVTPKGVPVNISDFNQYKAIITLNVHYDDLQEGFAETLESYVKDYAGGYICIGGENSYALGSYRNTALESVLPVHMTLQGDKEISKIAMAMVIDQSGSMEMQTDEDSRITGLHLAKQAAIEGVSELSANDEVGVLAFSSDYNWVIPMQNAKNQDQITEKIRTIGSGGGTSIFPALEEAYNQILLSDAKVKHIILLTDGQDSYGDYDDLFGKINENKITVSTVAVGMDSDQKLLEKIASNCGGRYYYTDANNSIPRIFAQEVYLSTNTYLINEEFYPVVSSQHEILDGVTEEGFPAMFGYIAASPKDTAEVVLESDKGDPICTVWQYGLGRSIAWNTDGTNEWTGNYALWENYPMLWSNMIHYIISDNELGEDNLEIVKEGAQATITYETKEYDKNTVLTAIVTDASGKAKEIELDAVKPGVFKGKVNVEDIGIYTMNIRKMSGKDVLKNYNTAYANQYSNEYRFTNTQNKFHHFIEQAKGKEISLHDDIWNELESAVSEKLPLAVPLIIFAMLLFLFDIVIRRLSIDVFSHLYVVWNKFTSLVKKKEKKPKKESRKERENKMTSDEIQMEAKNDALLNTLNKVLEERDSMQTKQVVQPQRQNVQPQRQNVQPQRQNVQPQRQNVQPQRQNVQPQRQSGNGKLDMNELLKKKKERE